MLSIVAMVWCSSLPLKRNSMSIYSVIIKFLPRILLALLILAIGVGLVFGIYFVGFKIIIYVIHEIATAIKSA